LKNNEAIQNNNIPPEKRKKVSAIGSSTSGISILATGLFTPKMMFASSKAKWPCNFLFSTDLVLCYKDTILCISIA